MITVDITTNNTVFDPLSGQGSWIQHRFGQRNYPKLSLDLDCIKDIINTHDTIFLRSVYGDPLCHPNIREIITEANSKSKSLIIFSYLNIKDNELIDLIAHSPTVSVYAIVDGYEEYGSTILESNQHTVFENLKHLGSKATIEYHLYTYNLSELNNIRDFCNQFLCLLKLQPGKNFGLPVTSIIDRSGTWLYDVVPVHSETDKISNIQYKEKTVEGYRSLLDYMKIVNGVSILDNPVITKVYKTNESFNADMISVSVTGHVFENTESMLVFSNALCPDWAINVDTVYKVARDKNSMDSYTVLVAKTLNEILDKGLTSFSNSNI